ncbi:MAG: ADP-ribosylglycohydrolase family protein, partial [Candidatus Aminicenantes bacterium]|nr:ADP-ribosylglycohydrolase family protein [Candidatus Aminicenantes bacterium]
MTDSSRFLGCMLGSALGDAIGELAFHNTSMERLSYKLELVKELIYTDDTAMAIGIAESLLERKNLNPEHLGETFRKNFKHEPWRGYASGPPTIFAAVTQTGATYIEAAKSLFGRRGSFGNGAAMRVAPIGLVYRDSSDLYETARLSASVTHAHPVGIDGAAVQAKAVALAVDLDPTQEFFPAEFLSVLIDFARTPQMKTKLLLVQRLIAENVSPMRAAQQIGRSVMAHESLPFSIYSFLLTPRSFENCLFCSILNGGDRDTLGAMACAISGAYLGVEALPQIWLKKLENRTYIQELTLKLTEIKAA